MLSWTVKNVSLDTTPWEAVLRVCLCSVVLGLVPMLQQPLMLWRRVRSVLKARMEKEMKPHVDQTHVLLEKQPKKELVMHWSSV